MDIQAVVAMAQTLINQIHWALLDLAISPALWFIVGLQRRAMDGFKISVELHIERRSRSG
jgi:hypothetical protein